MAIAHYVINVADIGFFRNIMLQLMKEGSELAAVF
jgi:hypothetical protein